MKMRVLACACALVIACCTFSFAQTGEIPSNAKQLAPGVYEWIDADGSTVQAAEGIEALNWMISKVEARIEELSATDPVDTESLSAVLKHHTRLLDYRERMLQDTTAEKVVCSCFSTQNNVGARVYQHPIYDFWMAEAWANGSACSGWTYDAMAVAVGVDSSGHKTVDCDYDGGTTASAYASVSTGYNPGQCLLAEAYLWVDKPAGCQDIVIHQYAAEGSTWLCSYNPCG